MATPCQTPLSDAFLSIVAFPVNLHPQLVSALPLRLTFFSSRQLLLQALDLIDVIGSPAKTKQDPESATSIKTKSSKNVIEFG
jgi:hypothetical protein